MHMGYDLMGQDAYPTNKMWIEREREIDRERERRTDRQTDRPTDGRTDQQTGRQASRQTERPFSHCAFRYRSSFRMWWRSRVLTALSPVSARMGAW